MPLPKMTSPYHLPKSNICLTYVIHTVMQTLLPYFFVVAQTLRQTHNTSGMFIIRGKTYYPTLLRTHNQIAECRGQPLTKDSG